MCVDLVRCLSPSADLQESDEPRFRELTETMLQYFDDDRLWETFGMDAGVIVSHVQSVFLLYWTS